MFSSFSIRCLFALTLLGLLASAGWAETDRPSRKRVLHAAVQAGEPFWHQVATGQPNPQVRVREVFSYASTLCQARQYSERLPRLLELATAAQDREVDSPTYGNFRWSLGDRQVTDQNAVEFCVPDAVDWWYQQQAWMAAGKAAVGGRSRNLRAQAFRQQLQALLTRSLAACRRHVVRPEYTNVALLNAGNLIVLGELLERSDAAQEGYQRLEAVACSTWEHGTREYGSPTYYGVNLDALHFIHAYAQRPAGRQLAQAMLELLWTDMALNWFPGRECLGGTHSRSYNFLQGRGGVDRYLWRHGWVSSGWLPSSTAIVHTRSSDFTPSDRLLNTAKSRFPRLVRQSWGSRASESKTHLLYDDVTLSCSGSFFGPQDVPLTVDLPGDRQMVRCYFLPDGRGDPYGVCRQPTGKAGQLKSLHLSPFWAAAQRTCDAVGLVVYRSEDAQQASRPALQSHWVVPRDVEQFRLRGQVVTFPEEQPTTPRQIEIGMLDPLVLRYGTAAIGMRVLWCQASDGRPATAALVDDGNPFGALRLTIDHHREDLSDQAGMAIWIRVGSGLTTERGFVQWAEQFEAENPIDIQTNADQVRFEVPGVDGPVAVQATAPYSRDSRVQLTPLPSASVLELDGQEIGRPLLEAAPAVAAYREQRHQTPVVRVPESGNVLWEAEQGSSSPGMLAQQDSIGVYVWHPPQPASGRPTGQTIWPLSVERAGAYYLWARVLTPDAESDSFYVETRSDRHKASEAAGIWHTGHNRVWRWRRVTLDEASSPTAWWLTGPVTQLVFRTREAGAKVDRLFLTSDAQARPR